MLTTKPDLFDSVKEEIHNAHLVAWDGCHKIYLAMDEIEAQWFLENYPEVVVADAETMLATVVKWYERSCWLRFVQAVAHNEEDPNLGYTTLIGQGDDAEDTDEEEEDYYYNDDEDDN